MSAAGSSLCELHKLSRAQLNRFHREGVHQDVGDRRHHFLLLFERRAEFLIRDAQREQCGLLRVGDQSALAGRWAGQNLGLQLLHRFHQRQLPALCALQHHAGGEQAVDFVGAFENAVDARIAIGALHGVVLMEAVAAVDLHAFIDHVIQHFRREDLDEGAFGGELLDQLSASLQEVFELASISPTTR